MLISFEGVFLGVGLIAATAAVLWALRIRAKQISPAPRSSNFRPIVGLYVQVGGRQDALKDAVIVGTHVAYVMSPELAIAARFNWLAGNLPFTAGTPRGSTITCNDMALTAGVTLCFWLGEPALTRVEERPAA